MKKEYKKPKMVSTEVLSNELMVVTSNVDMGGKTESFDASMRQPKDGESKFGDLW